MFVIRTIDLHFVLWSARVSSMLHAAGGAVSQAYDAGHKTVE